MAYEYDYYEPPRPEDYGYIHENNLPNLDLIRDFLIGIIESVYVTGDIDALENCLDEICCEFDLKLPNRKLVLCKKSDEFSSKIFNLGVALSRAQATATR